ncbi:hypothetical protein MAR_001894 [Mya arenaria]|uniref:Uncharacterized protein n=1 Tax=Mya arenaria TaxID=6604 RepID=A0ABY7FGH2_MYAAR|nr:hypothetical protein MAR_001894 [Mya arenaria]
MENTPELDRTMSSRMSMALGDVGVNSSMVRKQMSTFLMIEKGDKITFILFSISMKDKMNTWLGVFAHFKMNEHLRNVLFMASDLMPEQMRTFLCLYLQKARKHAHGLPFPLREKCFRYTSKRILSVLASNAASCCIRNGYGVPRSILSLFESSLDTDVASSRLKLASFLLCHNELERAAYVLNDVERRYDDSVQAVCECGRIDPLHTEHHKPMCTASVFDNDDVLLTNNTTFCVRYLRQEAFCAPPILRFEMVRGFGEELNHRNYSERKWMNSAVVDALPYLYYLQYLTFRGLGQQGRQVQAFNNLMNSVLDTSLHSQIYHYETFSNLFGHCLELEGKLIEAFLMYWTSVLDKPINNAARWHIYRLIHGIKI